MICFSIKLVGVDLGRTDLKGLQAIQKEVPHTGLSYFDPGRNPWHEAGLIASGLNEPVRRIHEKEKFIRSIQSGSLGILSQEHYAHVFKGTPPSGMRTLIWKRWAKKGEVRSSLKSSKPFDIETLKREFFILAK